MQSRHAWDDPILTQPVAAPSNRRAFRRYASPITRGGAQVHSFVGPALPIIPHPPPYASSEAMSQLHDKLIGTVPSRIVEQAAIALTTYDGRVAEFNVASWLQLQGHAGLMVSLVAKYRDGQQQQKRSLITAAPTAQARSCCPASRGYRSGTRSRSCRFTCAQPPR